MIIEDISHLSIQANTKTSQRIYYRSAIDIICKKMYIFDQLSIV